jgi:hypothetical protein
MSDSIKGGAMPVEAKPTRRLLLLGGRAAAVLATAKTAIAQTGAPDPIFAAIARHQEAFRTLGDVCPRIDEVVAEREGREVTEADKAAYEAACAAEMRAGDVFINMTPRTAVGMHAAIEWFSYYQKGLLEEGVELFFDALLQSPVLSLSREG